MQTEKVGVKGYPPQIGVAAGNPEALKYGRMWELEDYRKVSPGASLTDFFWRLTKPRAGASLIDFGCGTGRAALKLSRSGFNVTMIDFVRNSLDPEVRGALGDRLHFLKADLEQPVPAVAEYGYCVDVMEHIPEMRVACVLDNILAAAETVFFSISTIEDSHGALIDEKLHLTVKDYAWWLATLASRDAIVRWSEKSEDRCFFLVTAWKTGQDIVKTGKLNATDDQIRANVAHNIKHGWQQVRRHQDNDIECIILGGGPSLDSCEEEIRRNRLGGMKLITLNGAYNWCLERGLIPSAQIVVDARAFNARFTKPVISDCTYLLASQCDPAVFAGLPLERTWIWHCNPALIHDLLSAEYEATCTIPGGSSVLLRAIPLLRLLGYRKFHLYGCDSCLLDGAHHAFAQRENDGAIVLPVILKPSGKIFRCHPWMMAQAQEFMDLIKHCGNEIDLAVYGDGLLAEILRSGAELEELEPVISQIK